MMTEETQNIYLGFNSFIGAELFGSDESNNKLLLSNGEFVENYVPNEFISKINIYDCTFVSRGTEQDFFKINFIDKIKLLNKIENLLNKCKVNLIGFGSIHDDRNDIFGISKRFYKYLLNSIPHYEDLTVRYITLCGIYGPNVRPGKHSVVANFYHDLKKNKESYISDGIVELAHIDNLNYLLHSDLFISANLNGEFNCFKISGVKISVKNLYEIMKRICADFHFNDQQVDFKKIDTELKKWKN
jgi:hypothetical protein